MSILSRKNKWYSDGLRFQCQGCGNCCRGPGGYVWVDDDEIAMLAEAVKMGVEEFCRKFVRRSGYRYALIDNPAGDCIMLDEKGRCKVYESRPIQCRTYPWWPELLQMKPRWESERRNCPGIDNGEMHPLSEIEEGLSRNKSD